MEIALATHFHVPEIVELWEEFMDFHRSVDSFYTRSQDASVSFGKRVEESIESDDSRVLVALEEGRVVAFSIAHIVKLPPVFERKTNGYISEMAVRPHYRRKGIGERMLAKIYEWFESRNIDRIELRVVVGNQIGYSFWKKHGFTDYVRVLYLDR